jgi:hypothetical protein
MEDVVDNPHLFDYLGRQWHNGEIKHANVLRAPEEILIAMKDRC